MAFFSLLAVAQIVPDRTLGTESSGVTPNVTIKGAAGDRIDGGAVRGTSLFHSFSDFNVNAGQRVYFRDPAGIANILTRVTGSNVSNILGKLGVDGAANLYLLNPNDKTFPPHLAAIAINRCHPHQRCYLLAVQSPQLRQQGDQGAGCNHTDSRHRL